ncbi:hypothetical protein PHYSODRAFT_299167 [Phytophthora sojae]|uniref:Uncharacterized protein n=1 Tax=Phytophthora sojae (strain P6497) TaxID=1094619 RepID=G4Z2L2_PHYSP|nr:hypothetical protein PHYSODRAFT_299167 [Phytophthora sojae]EGZ21441.1 hypothetical protein PHYSODRAFT_299167 [Phytophthora sojae]|eukprot:XP_009524158.1 hypothetical protein PHYSODRAFT_299167 [Phytophthora sojae]
MNSGPPQSTATRTIISQNAKLQSFRNRFQPQWPELQFAVVPAERPVQHGPAIVSNSSPATALQSTALQTPQNWQPSPFSSVPAPLQSTDPLHPEDHYWRQPRSVEVQSSALAALRHHFQFGLSVLTPTAMSALMELEINLDDANLPTNKLLFDSRRPLDPTSAQGPYVSLDSDAGSTDAALTEVAAKTMFRAREARLHSSMNGLAGLISPLVECAECVQLGAQIEAQTKEIADLNSQNAVQSTAVEALTDSVRALTDEVKKLKTMSKMLLELAVGDPRETKRSRGMQQADQQPLAQTIDLLRAQLTLFNEPELEEKPHPSVIEQVRGQNQQVDGNQRSTQLTGRQQSSQLNANSELVVEIVKPGDLRAMEEELAAILRRR